MPGNYIKASHIDVGTLLSSLDASRTEIPYSHRRQKLVDEIADIAPDLLPVIESIDLSDDDKTDEGESKLANGAILAIKAITDFAETANEDYDVRNEATADYLGQLEAQDLEVIFVDALEDHMGVADDEDTKAYTFIREYLANKYPGIVEFIPKLAAEHMHRSKEFRNGVWLGAIQLALAIDAMASREDDGQLPSQINGHLAEINRYSA